MIAICLSSGRHAASGGKEGRPSSSNYLANAARQWAFTVRGASALRQHEDVK